MRIAFVGVEKDWDDLIRRDYVYDFVRYHLELPFYYARDGKNDVTVYTNISKETAFSRRSTFTALHLCPNEKWDNDGIEYDVVIHWRKWFPEFYTKGINLILSQDHSYGPEWAKRLKPDEDKCDGILCFPEWHQRQLEIELFTYGLHRIPLLPGVTLGVDTGVYRPSPEKSRQRLLWASDPGRGISRFIMTSVELAAHGFKTDICWPDYVGGPHGTFHPVVDVHRNLDNGPELWNLFNEAGFLPYTSTFKEPSSRAHRQAMAAGCIVLYPPDMGTPSDLITDDVDGFVRPVDEWSDLIRTVSSDEAWFNRISAAAREHAVRENWAVQAERFNRLIEEIS